MDPPRSSSAFIGNDGDAFWDYGVEGPFKV